MSDEDLTEYVDVGGRECYVSDIYTKLQYNNAVLD